MIIAMRVFQSIVPSLSNEHFSKHGTKWKLHNSIISTLQTKPTTWKMSLVWNGIYPQKKANHTHGYLYTLPPS
jgi:hypothetical protein